MVTIRWRRTGKMKKYLFLILITFSWSIYAQVSLSLHVDSNNISINDQITLQIRVNGSRDADEIKIHGLDNFQSQRAGTSSQINIINGRTAVSKIFNYHLYPKNEGSFTLGPAYVEIDGKTHNSNIIKIKVSKDTSGKAEIQKYFYITGEVTKTNLYKGEQLLYTFKLHQRTRLFSPALELPEFNGFWKEQIGKEKQYREDRNGIKWNVYELTYLLYPIKTGKITIPSASLNAEIAKQGRGRRRQRSILNSLFEDHPMFGERKRIRLRSKPVDINVRAIPDEGKPDNYTGLVGQFSLKAQLPKNSVRKGDSTTLTVTLVGQGSVASVELPQISNGNFKIYDDKPTFSKTIEHGKLYEKKVFKKALVPQKEGVVEIPRISINYFDPIDGSYKIASTDPISLNVSPAAVGEENFQIIKAQTPTETGKKKIKILAQDLRPIFYNTEVLDHEAKGVWFKVFLLSLLIIFPALYFFMYFYQKRLVKLQNDSGHQRRSRAFRTFNGKINNISTGKGFCEDASKVLKTYIGDKTTTDGMAITSYDLDRILLSKNVRMETVARVKKIMNDLDQRQYGGGMAGSVDDYADFLRDIRDVVKTIEKEIRA